MRRIEVEWVDSQVSRDGWEPVSDILARRETVRCWSIGYVLADDENGIVLAGSLNNNHVTGVITIPAVQVVKRHALKQR